MKDTGGDNLAAAGGVLPPPHRRARVIAVIEEDDGGDRLRGRNLTLDLRSLPVEVAGGVRLAAPGGDLFPPALRFFFSAPAGDGAFSPHLMEAERVDVGEYDIRRLLPRILQPPSPSSMKDTGGDNLAAAGGVLPPPHRYVGVYRLIPRSPVLDDTLLAVIEEDDGGDRRRGRNLALDLQSLPVEAAGGVRLAEPGGDLFPPVLCFVLSPPVGNGAFSPHLMEAETDDVGEDDIRQLLTVESHPVLPGSGYAGERGDAFVLLDGALETEPEDSDHWQLFTLGQGSPPVTAGYSPGGAHGVAVARNHRFSVAGRFKLAPGYGG